MYMFGLSSILFIRKLTAGKEFKLVKREFRQKKKKKKHVKKPDASNLKTKAII